MSSNLYSNACYGSRATQRLKTCFVKRFSGNVDFVLPITLNKWEFNFAFHL